MVWDAPKDRRRRRTRTAVLDAAHRLFTVNGFRATSVESLAEAADVALSSIYANFPGGKADVYLALAVRLADEHAATMTGALARPGVGAAAAFDAYVQFHRDEPGAFRLLGLTDVSDADSDLVAEARTRIGETLRGVAATAAAAIGGPDAQRRVLLVWAMVNGILALRERGLVDAVTADALLGDARASVAS
ncbi:TetR/AcrR family transcriptional regulator [Rhodococcus rhodnii]|uniref:HTH tetR-type domain-containing protein n=2 Tax=Rhodococcus rhodnii TaxID=38312 RepID=R7WHU4_9NOCA|nr:TetR/AcrR family transcriptional regulator [Rhodococcus rhodnii]EOM74711.1 hypothetical protein Rrhod_3978 [Rhodococcus rhodnii LMG 5362]TXG88936.1 TetR/AcrR family transcriptional regulator [Rhodococcus rhodnii]